MSTNCCARIAAMASNSAVKLASSTDLLIAAASPSTTSRLTALIRRSISSCSPRGGRAGPRGARRAGGQAGIERGAQAGVLVETIFERREKQPLEQAGAVHHAFRLAPRERADDAG